MSLSWNRVVARLVVLVLLGVLTCGAVLLAADGDIEVRLPSGDPVGCQSAVDLRGVAIEERQSLTLIIENVGDLDLSIGDPSWYEESNISNYGFTSLPAQLLEPGESTSLTFEFDVTDEGLFSFRVRIPTNDPDPQESPCDPRFFGDGHTTPTVVSVTPSIDVISDGNVGSSAFELVVEFSQRMSHSYPPTISFPTENPASTISFADDRWESDSWVYVAEYHVEDSNVRIDDIDVRVSDGRDDGGPTQEPRTVVDVFTIDTQNPTVTVDIIDALLSDSDNSSNVAFTFSETVNGFDVGDVDCSFGSISGFTGSGSSYSATYTANEGIDDTGTVIVYVDSYTDAAGNLGSSGSDDVDIDTVNPIVSVDIVDASLSDSDNSSNVTFSFSENVTGFDAGDLTLVGGTVIGFGGSGSSYSATFIANDGIDTTGSVTVNADSYTDMVGNLGGSGSDTVDIDTHNPTVTVNIVDASLSDSDNSSNVTFTFSEATSDFTSGDLAVVGGTISGFSGSGTSYSATFTADDDTDVMGSVTVNAGSYADAAGNTGASGSDTVDIDTLSPTPTITTSPDPIYEGALTLTVTVAYDEAMNPATSPVITLTGSNWGAQTGGAWSGGDTTYTCTFVHGGTEEEMTAEVASIAVGSGATDVAGNAENGADSPSFEIDTRQPRTTVTVDHTTVAGGTSIYEGSLMLTVTVTYDESMDTGTSPVIALSAGSWGSQTAIGWSTTTHTNDTYTATFTHTGVEEPSLPAFAISVDTSVSNGSGATDVAGNAEVGDTTDTPFEIDTRKPRTAVTVDHTTVAGGTPIYEGSLMLTVTVTYDESMDTGTSPVIALSAGSWGSQTAIGWSTTTHTNDTYTATFTHTGLEEPSLPAFAISVDASVASGSGATDVAGNAEVGDTTDSPFEIDTRKPRARVFVDHTTVAAGTPIYEGSLILTVTVTYDESMDTGTTPVIVLSAGSWGPQTTVGWSTTTHSNDTYAATFTHTGVEEPSLPAFTIPVSASVANGSGATDLAGNAEVGDITDADFEIDTRKPRATVTVNRTTVAAGQPIYEDALTLVVTVTYDEPMDTSTSPVIDLSDGSWGPQTAVGWSQTTYANDTYTATFTHTGVEEPVSPPSPPISVLASVANGSGAKDLAGNAEVGDAIDSPFEVDTRKPEMNLSVGVSGVSVDTDPVYEEDLAQLVTVTFDEPMDAGTTPTVSFSHGSWTSFGGWWIGTTVWQQTFMLTDNDEEYYLSGGSVVEVDVNGARDAAGNLQEPYAEVPQFDIDTVKPRIVNITSTTPDSCYIAGSNINLTMTFSEDVSLSGTVDVTLDVGGSRSVHASLSLTNARTASGTYTVEDGENSCDLDVIGVNINAEGGLIDWTGNYERNALTLPPGSYRRNGSTISVEQNLAANKDILVDTTIPVAVDDPEGIGDLGNNPYHDSHPEVGVILDPDGKARVAVRSGEISYIDVLGNDFDLPCDRELRIHDFPVRPSLGRLVEETQSSVLAYSAPDACGYDQLTYRMIDACGNISEPATVYLAISSLPTAAADHALTRTNTPVSIDVVSNDSAPCGDDIETLEIAWTSEPMLGTVSTDHHTIRYAPHMNAKGEDSFQYAVRHVSGVVAVGDVHVVIGEELASPDIYGTTCMSTPTELSLIVSDPWINPEDLDELPLRMSIAEPPHQGIALLKSDALRIVNEDAWSDGIPMVYVTLTYVPAMGFEGEDTFAVEIADPFGGSTTQRTSILVRPCEGVPSITHLNGDQVFRIVTPETFATIVDTAWESVLLVRAADRQSCAVALDAGWDEDVGRFILKVDSALLELGTYRLTVPLGNGQTVELTIEVGEAK